MRSQKINYFIVGSFVLAAIGALVVSIALLTGRTGATDDYFAVYDNVTGIKFGTTVLYEGYPIGQVETVTPQKEGGRMRFRVDMSVVEGWRIPEDSIAQIAAPSLLSAMTISISAGKSATALTPGSRVEGRPAADLFGAVSSMAGEVSQLAEQDIRPLLASLNVAAKSFSKILDEDVPELTRDLLALTRDLTARVPRIASDVEEVARKMNSSADALQALFSADNQTRLQGIIENFDSAARDLNELSAGLKETRGTLDQLLKTSNDVIAENRPDAQKTIANLRYVVDSVARHIDAVNENLEGASRNMYEFSRQIRQNPGLLLGGTPPADSAGR